MLAGEPPFTGSSAQSVIAKRLYEPPPRSDSAAFRAGDRERILLRALDRTPADRYSTAEEFRDALARHESALATPSPVIAEGRRSPRVRGVAVVALVLAALAIGWRVTNRWNATAPVITLAVLHSRTSQAIPRRNISHKGWLTRCSAT